MTEETKERIRRLAEQYHEAGFIKEDPVQFPHRFTDKRDIEASGLLTALLSFGNRTQIRKKAEELHALMGPSPHAWLLSGRWQSDFPADRRDSFYRMLSYADMRGYCQRLRDAYATRESLEDALLPLAGSPMERLCAFLEVSPRSPQKKLNMFLRWMIRRDSPVDFGIWPHFDPRELLVPLDTHVCQEAFRLGLVATPCFTLNNARRITAALAEVFPDDPCLGDFALFGLGVHPSE